MECCFQAGRPPAERLKNLCVACLVFDAIFVFIYTGTALIMTTPTPKTACYEEMGYGWHNMLTLSYTVSAMSAVVGAVVHASVSCSPSITPAHLTNIARYAHALVFWTFVAAVIEAVADRQEPPECSNKDDDATTASPSDQSQAVQTQMIWQVAYSALWLSWLTGVVAAAYMARRVAPYLVQADSAAAAVEAGQGAVDPSQGGPPPQTVGVPVQMSMGAPDCQGGTVTGAPLAFGSVPGGAAPGFAVSAGAPFSTAPGGVPGAAAGATWEGAPVFAGGIVAQGRPVPGSAPDPDKQRAAGPKTVD